MDYLSEVLFSFVLEKYIVCDIWGLRSSSNEFTRALYTIPNDNASIQQLLTQEQNQRLNMSCSLAKRTLGMLNLNIFYNLLNMKFLIVNTFE